MTEQLPYSSLYYVVFHTNVPISRILYSTTKPKILVYLGVRVGVSSVPQMDLSISVLYSISNKNRVVGVYDEPP